MTTTPRVSYNISFLYLIFVEFFAELAATVSSCYVARASCATVQFVVNTAPVQVLLLLEHN